MSQGGVALHHFDVGWSICEPLEREMSGNDPGECVRILQSASILPDFWGMVPWCGKRISVGFHRGIDSEKNMLMLLLWNGWIQFPRELRRKMKRWRRKMKRWCKVVLAVRHGTPLSLGAPGYHWDSSLSDSGFRIPALGSVVVELHSYTMTHWSRTAWVINWCKIGSTSMELSMRILDPQWWTIPIPDSSTICRPV